MPSIGTLGADPDKRAIPTATSETTRDEFSEAARRYTKVPIEAVAYVGPLETGMELGPLLGTIAEDVMLTAAAEREGIISDFAARAAYARRHLRGNQRAGALQVIAQLRGAALALAAKNAKAELHARTRAAIELCSRPCVTPKGDRTRKPN